MWLVQEVESCRGGAQRGVDSYGVSEAPVGTVIVNSHVKNHFEFFFDVVLVYFYLIREYCTISG